MFTSALRRQTPVRKGFSLRRLLIWASLRRQRQHLLELDAHLLADIGVTAQAAQAEADRPFWDAPESWKR
ncbi:DUF1127 domain-containing protein [Neogemmobacter tilapiae]|uniref:YjiS-like domain-containing protein n=1 Tax=Neogemmobacter tilapiae TaxID=875041 RepID=A0A918WIE2_9RHOB|nr:DUF1127 domain-containing protein [Gemmobacter tilapiae]GHC49131.1 hypothetical protein GCM10007315_09050 [Gemmobacter tilapiae]